MSTLFVNAAIRMGPPGAPRATAMLVRAGRIAEIGGDELRDQGIGAEVIDLRGRTVTAGFNDCHMHVLSYGVDLTRADLSVAAGVVDLPTLIEALRAWQARNPSSPWILGNRYDQNVFPGGAHPTSADLDEAFPGRPVLLVQVSGHGGCASTVALRAAGIDCNTPDPPGGVIVRDHEGEPTGVLLETALWRVASRAPRLDIHGRAAAIREAARALARAGVTSASDMGVDENEIAAYRLAAEAPLGLRVTLFPHAPALGAPGDLPGRSAFADAAGLDGSSEWLRLGALKLFADGALTLRTAALDQPYADGSGAGVLLHEPQAMTDYIRSGHANGWQMAIHAIGDRAIRLVLDGYALAESDLPTGGARRHRIEHAMILDPALIGRLHDQKVTAVMQPEFLARLGDAYVQGLGEPRASALNPMRQLICAGVPAPFSSDCPVVPGAPLDGIRAAISRTTRSGRVLGACERITAAEALEAYTRLASWSVHDENESGALEPGKRADLVILSEDPCSEGLQECEVLGTMAGGEWTYRTPTIA